MLFGENDALQRYIDTQSTHAWPFSHACPPPVKASEDNEMAKAMHVKRSEEGLFNSKSQ